MKSLLLCLSCSSGADGDVHYCGPGFIVTRNNFPQCSSAWPLDTGSPKWSGPEFVQKSTLADFPQYYCISKQWSGRQKSALLFHLYLGRMLT